MTLIRTKIPPRRYITRAQAMMAEKRFCLESYLYDPSVLSSSSATANGAGSDRSLSRPDETFMAGHQRQSPDSHGSGHCGQRYSVSDAYTPVD
ncbi:hypothetical protein HPB47_000374 [Ixodes persulcatus]|uniref:Uncharacterized protein n=1 Tax=Ixodes persulcatus TaxID=34615 RepID=A0AC60PRZ4_IXOPE|nr:hypothetical protein HPB47_000374 [Ixodes persulcatus]